jgi:signal transduction histidine kinase
VLSNLLGNAIKFCSGGDSVLLRAVRAGDYVRFSVIDSGPGIEAEALAHIFEPYWSAPQHARKGTGLGLFIAKGIVEAHGGQLWAESAPSEGSAFHFTLPIVEPTIG